MDGSYTNLPRSPAQLEELLKAADVGGVIELDPWPTANWILPDPEEHAELLKVLDHNLIFQGVDEGQSLAEGKRTLPRGKTAAHADFYKAVGQAIRTLRLAKRWNQTALAKAIGVSRVTMTNWELGNFSIDAHHLVAIARALGVATSVLLGEERVYDGNAYGR